MDPPPNSRTPRAVGARLTSALVNYAGIFFTPPFTDYTAEEFKSLVSTNDGSALDGPGHHQRSHVAHRRRDGHGSHPGRRWRLSFRPLVMLGVGQRNHEALAHGFRVAHE